MNYVISDIHNDNKRFCQLLNKLQLKEQDRLYILGDVFDRSNHDANPVDLYFNILSLGERCRVIRGNHDQWLAMYILEYYALSERKRKNVKPYPYNSFLLLQERLTPVDLQNLAEMILSWPLQMHVELGDEQYLLAHAMTAAPESIQTEEHYLMGSTFSKFYSHYGVDGYTSVIGHTNTEDGCIWKNRKGNLYMIDCGCGFSGGNLGCMCLETKEEFYV